VQSIFYGLACAEAEPLWGIKTQEVAQHRYTGRSYKNFKHEILNSIQIQNSKFKCSQSYFWISVIRYLNLFRISILEFQIYRYEVTLRFLPKFSKPLYVKSGVVGYHEATAQNVLWIIGKNLYTDRREGLTSGL